MKRNIKSVVVILLSICLFAISSCTKSKTIEFDSSDPLALATDLEWAVISDPYVAFRTEPGYEKSVSDYGRVGDIFMVIAKSYVTENKQQTLWYEFEKGWLDQNVISVYDNKLKAQSASRALLNH